MKIFSAEPLLSAVLWSGLPRSEIKRPLFKYLRRKKNMARIFHVLLNKYRYLIKTVSTLSAFPLSECIIVL